MLTRPPPISCGVAKALNVQAKAVVTPATTPGIDNGSVMVRKVADRPGAEAVGRPLESRSICDSAGRQHDHHHRHGHMDKGDHHAEGGEHELDRLVDQAETAQHRIDEAVIAEHDDPGIGAHDFAEEQRRDDDDKQDRFQHRVLHAHQRVGDRIADDQRCRPRSGSRSTRYRGRPAHRAASADRRSSPA